MPVRGLVRVGSDLDRLRVRGARRLLALAAHAGEGEDHDRGKDAEHDDDNEQFDQGEAVLAGLARLPALHNFR